MCAGIISLPSLSAKGFSVYTPASHPTDRKTPSQPQRLRTAIPGLDGDSSGTGNPDPAWRWDSRASEKGTSGILCHRAARKRPEQRSGRARWDQPSPRVPLAQDENTERVPRRFQQGMLRHREQNLFFHSFVVRAASPPSKSGGGRGGILFGCAHPRGNLSAGPSCHHGHLPSPSQRLVVVNTLFVGKAFSFCTIFY